jgi:outer membrane protein assembly factor BamA
VIRNQDGTQSFVIQDRSDNYPEIGVGLVGDTVLYQEWGPLSGTRFRVGFNYAPDFTKDETTVFGEKAGSTLTQDVTVDLRHYFKITARSLVAVRLFGARSTGNFPNVYYFGGLDTLRGLDFREQIGNEVAYANFEYRFPLIDLLAFPWGGFRDVRGKVFFDIGAAKLKNQDFDFTDPDDDRRLKDGRAAYGYGIQFSLFGLQLHWDFSKLTDLKKSQSGLKTSFYIGAEF